MTNELMLFISGSCAALLLSLIGLALCKAAGYAQNDAWILEDKVKRSQRNG